jgi:hypothetical protein
MATAVRRNTTPTAIEAGRAAPSRVGPEDQTHSAKPPISQSTGLSVPIARTIASICSRLNRVDGEGRAVAFRAGPGVGVPAP